MLASLWSQPGGQSVRDVAGDFGPVRHGEGRGLRRALLPIRRTLGGQTTVENGTKSDGKKIWPRKMWMKYIYIYMVTYPDALWCWYIYLQNWVIFGGSM